MDALTDILRINTEIASRFGEVRKHIEKCNSITDLFETWYLKVGEVFSIPFLWITIFNEEITLSLRESLERSEILKDRINLIDRKCFEGLTGGQKGPILVNGDIRPYFVLLPRQKYLLHSMALAPFEMNGEIMGSLNHGDSSPTRYSPEMDTTLLAAFVRDLSLRLTEIVYIP